MNLRAKRLPPILALYSVAILCPALLYSVAKAQEQPGCFITEPSGQTTDLTELCDAETEGGEVVEKNPAEEAFQNARQLAKAMRHQEAIDEYTRAIELNPEFAESYFFRSATLALMGQEQAGIEDARKAAAIFRSRGDEERAKLMDGQAESIQGINAEGG